MRSLNFSIDLILLASYGPGIDLPSNITEYQEIFYGKVKRGQLTRKADFTAIYESTVQNMGASTSHNHMGPQGLLQS
jgi:hypothetical protein